MLADAVAGEFLPLDITRRPAAVGSARAAYRLKPEASGRIPECSGTTL